MKSHYVNKPFSFQEKGWDEVKVVIKMLRDVSYKAVALPSLGARLKFLHNLILNES